MKRGIERQEPCEEVDKSHGGRQCHTRPGDSSREKLGRFLASERKVGRKPIPPAIRERNAQRSNPLLPDGNKRQSKDRHGH